MSSRRCKSTKSRPCLRNPRGAQGTRESTYNECNNNKACHWKTFNNRCEYKLKKSLPERFKDWKLNRSNATDKIERFTPEQTLALKKFVQPILNRSGGDSLPSNLYKKDRKVLCKILNIIPCTILNSEEISHFVAMLKQHRGELYCLNPLSSGESLKRSISISENLSATEQRCLSKLYGFKKYQLIRKLGSGSFGKVFEIRANNINRAVKIMEVKTLQLKNVFREIILGQFLNSKGCVKCNNISLGYNAAVVHHERGKWYSDKWYRVKWYIACEMPICNLGHELQTLSSTIAISLKKHIIALLIEGLAIIHENGIVHRDIKSENILVCGTTGQERPMYIDFGFSHIQGFNRTGVLAGTPLYMSIPNNDNKKGDIYSLVITIIRILSRRIFTRRERAMPEKSNLLDTFNMQKAFYSDWIRMMPEHKHIFPGIALRFLNLLTQILRADINDVQKSIDKLNETKISNITFPADEVTNWPDQPLVSLLAALHS